MDYSSYRQQWIVLQEDLWEACTRSYPLKTSPLQIRPVVIFVLAAWLVILGVLGMAPIPEVPVNDKVLHFFGMGIATFLLYFVIVVPDHARRIWYYRRAPLILTLICGFFSGGILSEIAQGWLPANLLGSSAFFCLAHELKRRSRKRFEISRLYQPISSSNNFHSRARDRFQDLERDGRASHDSYDVDEEDVWGDAASQRGTRGARGARGQDEPSTAQQGFSLGDDDDDEEIDTNKTSGPGNTTT
ncbi:hypothetical protein FFLO_00202 [Filobasidium floriforme]|uniref:Transmembrane protein n=1 Tax=Filobasidium floriforme TaxID=5210 RepID=A0A8K0JWS3_9TREE|nr:uncharacterized protein HD553DRAFT_270019 [Filobasidium floriforme]KAG7579994.1 hypothetical protein FFLO_00202 [Filobasidium floriforme]KAH8087395.1 hypothetical protein HD553DRAFT_270019 [Filobasidium floriforme]